MLIVLFLCFILIFNSSTLLYDVVRMTWCIMRIISDVTI